eukprot:199350-Rhodomonas_salina.3
MTTTSSSEMLSSPCKTEKKFCAAPFLSRFATTLNLWRHWREARIWERDECKFDNIAMRKKDLLSSFVSCRATAEVLSVDASSMIKHEKLQYRCRCRLAIALLIHP